MIHFTLCCDQAHRFDGWFRSNEDFDKQCKSGLVSCPVCGSTSVEKALMTPAIAHGDKQELSAEPSPPTEKDFWRAWHEAARKIRETSDYVGQDFAETARKIHFGEVEPRAIYGEAERAEIVSLLDDGVDILPLPPLPEKQN